MRSRTLRYVLAFGIVFTLFSIPFITGMMRPSFSEKNPYALFYAFCNFPFRVMLAGAIDALSESLWENPTFAQRNMVEFVVSLCGWSLLGGVIGLVKDIRGGRA